MSDEFEKNLPPSERKLQKAKEDGNGLKLQDLMLLGSFVCVVGGYIFVLDILFAEFAKFKNLLNFWSKDGIAYKALWDVVVNILLISLLPVLMTSVIMSIVGWLVGGMIFSSKAITFDLERIDPVKKMGSMFKFGASTILWPLIKGIVMICITLICSFLIFIKLGTGGVESIWDILKIVSYIALGFVFFAGIDSFVQWWKRNQELMMSYQEMVEEMKETEGNPMIKWRQRSIARERSRARMMAAVAKSDVVIVNPEHFLVALKWNKETDSAPIVVAKGRNEIALNLKKQAKDCGVAVLEMPPLARALWHKVPLDKPVPENFFKAIAMVFAWLSHIENGLKDVSLNEGEVMEGLESA